jgi:hypothetical protein
MLPGGKTNASVFIHAIFTSISEQSMWRTDLGVDAQLTGGSVSSSFPDGTVNSTTCSPLFTNDQITSWVY